MSIDEKKPLKKLFLKREVIRTGIRAGISPEQQGSYQQSAGISRSMESGSGAVSDGGAGGTLKQTLPADGTSSTP